jgi:C4-dicarboxylate transporter DctM subunit
LIAVMILFFVILAFAGVPIAISLGFSSIIYFLVDGTKPLLTIPQKLFSGADSFGFMAIPFFLFAGEIMNGGGITRRIIAFANSVVGHLRGGLGYVSVIVNMILAGMSGSAIADAAATGSILIPAMTKSGYDKKFAAAVVATSGTVGPVIPPSIPMVVYASIAGVSVGKLFLGGALPGVAMGLFIMVVVYFIAKKRDYPREKRATLKELIISIKDALLALAMPGIIFASIIFGIATVTEAAVIATVYAIIVSMFIYKELTIKKLIKIAIDVSLSSATIMFVIAAAGQFGWVLSVEQIPIILQNMITSITSSQWVLLLSLNFLILFLGCFMEGNAIIIILTPVLLPVLKAYGVDLVHVGVLFVLNVMIGMLTPPVGLNLFVTSKISGIGVTTVVKELGPFFVALLVVLLLVTYWPPFSLWLPGLIR